MSQRNNLVDIIRGFAMLLVVLGHTMSGSTSGFQDSFLFQVIWTLQMPLFIIISGYVTRYSKPIINGNSLWKFVKKRTLSYLLPWIVWTFLVKGVVLGQAGCFDLKYLLWHMDSGYWFLITIWTICTVFGIADLLSNKIAGQTKVRNIICHLAICGVGMVLLGVTGLVLGLSFFCIKLTLFYLPIYLLGYLYGQLQDYLMEKRYSEKFINGTIVMSLAFWLVLITRFDFFSGADSGLMILFRFVSSILGCVCVIGLFLGIYDDGEVCVLQGEPNTQLSAIRETKTASFLKWTGVHSLEIYLVHSFSLCLLRMEEVPLMYSIESWCLIVADFVIAVGLSVFYIRLIDANKLLNKILFWK